MDIPTGEISSDYYQSRIRRMVELQRRWTGWVDSGLPLCASSAHNDRSTRSVTPTTCGGRAVRRPASALASSSNERGHCPSSLNATVGRVEVSRGTDVVRREAHVVGQPSQHVLSHLGRRPASKLGMLEAARFEATKVDASLLSSRIDLMASTQQENDSTLDTGDAQYSQFGVSASEVVSLKGLCDALSTLGGNGGPQSATCLNLSVESAVSALEAATHIFREHPLFSYFFHVLSECLPRGIYTNPLPLLAEAAQPPRAHNSTPQPIGASEGGNNSAAARREEVGPLWVDWIIARAAQWSRLCAPLGVVTKLFDVGRSDCLSASTSGSAPRTRSPAKETLGAKMFGALQGGGKGTSRDQSPAGGRRIQLLSQNFTAWHNLTASCVERRRCVLVCSRGARKGVLLNAFTQWRCGTVVSLAMRKSGHAERLHYVVKDDARKLEAADLEIRNLRRQRDAALCRIDQLIDDSKLAIAKARDFQNGMVIDFRKPIIPTSQRSRIPFGTAEPLVSGCIYFQQQPQVPLIGRSSSPRASSPMHEAYPEDGPSGVVAKTLPIVPVQFSYDCGVERPTDGVALPHAQNFRSFYRISVEGINEKQQQKVASAPSDPLLRWVNDEVVACCAQLIRVSEMVPSPRGGSTTGPVQSRSRTEVHGGVRRATPTALPVSEFGALGASYVSYLQDWQEALQCWEDESSHIRSEHDPMENVCISTVDARSSRLAPHVVMSCHVHRPRDMCEFPFIYALLLYKACPRIIQLYGPAAADTVDGDALGSTLPQISLVEQLALLVKRTSSMKGLYALLQAAGVVQHLPLSVLEKPVPDDGSGGASSGVALNHQLDAAHRLLLVRIQCFGMMVAEYEPFWKLTMRGVPYHQAQSLQDLVMQRAGAHHTTEMVASEVLGWVRTVLMSADTPCSAAEESDRLGKSFTTHTAHVVDARSVGQVVPSSRQRLLLSSSQSNVLNQGDRSLSLPPSVSAKHDGAGDVAAAEILQHRFQSIDNLSESFGEGLELLWIIVERLTPINNTPFAAYVASKPLHRKASRLTSQEGNATIPGESPCPELSDPLSHTGMDDCSSSLRVSPRASVGAYDALSLKEVASILCASLRDVFGCRHVPQILFDELYLATPSIKLMFLTCLYCTMHATSSTECQQDVAAMSGTKNAGSAREEKSRSIVKTAPQDGKSKQRTTSAPPEKCRKIAAPYVHPSVYESLTPSLLSHRYALDEAQVSQLIELLKSHNEMMYHLFLKYAVLATPPIRMDDNNNGASTVASLSLDASNLPSPCESTAATITLSYIGVEMIARDVLFGFSFHSAAQTPAYLASPEVASATLTAIRQSYVDLVQGSVEDFPTARTGGSLGAALMACNRTIPCHQFGELLLHLCWLLSPMVVRHVQKQQHHTRGGGKHTAASVDETAALSLVQRLEVILSAAEDCFLQHRVQSDNGPQRVGVSASGKVDRDTLASTFLDVDRVRSAVVSPAVFREKAHAVVMMFVHYSHWKSSERWNVLSERKMTRTLFLAFCEAAGILEVPSASIASAPSFSSPERLGKSDALQAVASCTAQLGWVPAVLDARTAPAALYARVSPIHDLLSSKSGSAISEMSAAVKKRRPDKSASPNKAAHQPQSKLSMSKGLRVNLLRSIPVDLSMVSFQVVALTRASSGALALDRLLHQLIPSSAAPSHRAATTESDGYCEEDGFNDPSEPSISYAGFCEVLTMLAQQCLPLPWISHAARTSLFVDLVYGVVTSEQ